MLKFIYAHVMRSWIDERLASAGQYAYDVIEVRVPQSSAYGLFINPPPSLRKEVINITLTLFLNFV